MKRRDLAAWALYVRESDGARMLDTLGRLQGVVAHHGGRVAGMYADAGPDDAGELAVLIEHAMFDRFSRVVVERVADLGVDVPDIARTVNCLFDLGVQLYTRTYLGLPALDAAAYPLDLEAIGVDLGVEFDADGRPAGLLQTRIGTAEGRPPRPQ